MKKTGEQTHPNLKLIPSTMNPMNHHRAWQHWHTRGRFQTPCRSASEGPGPLGSFSGEPHDWTPSPICHEKTMRLHQATRHLCNYDESMYTPLSVRSSHDLGFRGQVGLATKHQTIGLPMASQILPLLNMGQKSSHTWDIEHLVMWDKAISKQPVFQWIKKWWHFLKHFSPKWMFGSSSNWNNL